MVVRIKRPIKKPFLVVIAAIGLILALWLGYFVRIQPVKTVEAFFRLSEDGMHEEAGIVTWRSDDQSGWIPLLTIADNLKYSDSEVFWWVRDPGMELKYEIYHGFYNGSIVYN